MAMASPSCLLALSPCSSLHTRHLGAPMARLTPAVPLVPHAVAFNGSGVAARVQPRSAAAVRAQARVSSCAMSSRSNAVTVKSTKTNMKEKLKYAESAMQGNSENMEDTLQEDVDTLTATSFFRVSDGRGERSAEANCRAKLKQIELLGHEGFHSNLSNAVTRKSLRHGYLSENSSIGNLLERAQSYYNPGIYRRTASAVSGIISSLAAHAKDKRLLKMVACLKVERNAKGIIKFNSAHSGCVPRLLGKENAGGNHGSPICNIMTLQGCVWGGYAGVISTRHRLPKSPRAMAGGDGELENEDQSEEKFQKEIKLKEKPDPTLWFLLLVALGFGIKDHVVKILKSKGLDSRRSIVLLSSLLCAAKSVYDALKEAKEVGELILFYLKMKKKRKSPRKEVVANGLDRAWNDGPSTHQHMDLQNLVSITVDN
ncbi:hypothetical protein ACP70R_010430 [Stipagrostis hirtigluma subsp. patula]